MYLYGDVFFFLVCNASSSASQHPTPKLSSISQPLSSPCVTLKEISVVIVKPCVMTGSSSVVRPFQQSSSMHLHPDRRTCLYISTEELPASWPAESSTQENTCKSSGAYNYITKGPGCLQKQVLPLFKSSLARLYASKTKLCHGPVTLSKVIISLHQQHAFPSS